jgi:hypothetical protein
MSADWQPGDLALCVNAGAMNGHGAFGAKVLRGGAIYTVVWIVPPALFADGSYEIGLVLAEVANPDPANTDGDFSPQRFRKIRPLTDEEREQFAADLNVREPAHV